MQTFSEIVQLITSDIVERNLVLDSASIEEELKKHNVMLQEAEIAELISAVSIELTGYGPLASIITSKTTDVVVNAPDSVWVDNGCGLALHQNIFSNTQSISFLARRLASMANARLDESQPFVDGRLPNGVRLHALLPPISGSCAKLSLRFPNKHIIPIAQWQKHLSNHEMQLLSKVVRGEYSFLIAGETGAGKTTLLKSILAERPLNQRILIIEESSEIQLQLPNIASLVARKANTEGIGEVTMQNLVRQALRMRPDALVIGEVRGAEILDFLLAISSGHIGSGTTIHSSPRGVSKRIQLLAGLANISPDFATELFESAIDVVIHCERFGNTRRISSVIKNGDQ